MTGACAVEPIPALDSQQQPIVYGEDDRTEVYAYPDELFRQRAQNSVVALLEPWRVQQSGDSMEIMARTLGTEYELCSDQRFTEQPSAADCSGVLIDYDLVLTAGHCFDVDDSCDRYSYVFDFFYAGDGQLEHVDENDVFGCRRLVSRTVSPIGSVVEVDYAIVQLDRAVPAPRLAAPVRTAPLEPDEQVVVIGYTSGVPAKIDDGGRIIDPRSAVLDYFAADTDTFSGSSGSGTFDADGKLLGILVRGGVDYSVADGQNCLQVNEVADGDDGSPYEQITYVDRALKVLCEDLQWPSAALCNAEPVCGDGVCSPQEAGGLCAADCQTPICLGRRCGKDANPTCEGDACLALSESGEPADAGHGLAGAGGVDEGCNAGGGAQGWWWLVGLAVWSGARRRRSLA